MNAPLRIGLLVLLLGLAACAPRLQPPGEMLQVPHLESAALLARDGRRLPLKTWPASGPERAVVIALHGFADYSNAFAEPGMFWAGQGITTYAYDQRGFGGTAFPGIWAGTGPLKDDLVDAIHLVRARHPGAPLYILGESMGAAVAMVALAEGEARVDGLILSAPAVWGRDTMNFFYRGALWLVAHTVPWDPVTGSGLNIQASDNIEMLRALTRDPLVQKQARIDAIWGLVDLMDAANLAAPELETPLLILYGGHDQVVPKRSVETMLRKVDTPRRVVVYPNGWHLLLRDLQRQVVWDDVLAWMLNGTADLPSGLERSSAAQQAGP